MSLPVLVKLRKYAGFKRNDAIKRAEGQQLAKQTRRENATHKLFVCKRHPYFRGVSIISRDWSSHRLRRALADDDWLTQYMFIVMWLWLDIVAGADVCASTLVTLVFLTWHYRRVKVRGCSGNISLYFLNTLCGIYGRLRQRVQGTELRTLTCCRKD